MMNNTTIPKQPISDQFAQPEVTRKKGFSPIWILPIVAFLIGVGLIVKSYMDAGIMITLQVPSAEGIEVGKTHILYKGISTGVVKKRIVTEDLQNVILHIEMHKRTKPFLNENTVFWVVEPRVSLSGISGLDTLLGGRYIALMAGETGEEKRKFVALEVPPPPSTETPGLHLKLRLNRLASIDRGTLIYYKQIPVGKVTNYTLAENDTEIHAWVLIEPKYAHLVKENSHFYNISGINMSADLSGIDIKTESFITMLVGGIAFYNPDTKGHDKPAQENSYYLLYSDFESAKVGVPIILRFDKTNLIQENNTVIKFQGKTIGRLGDFSYDKNTNEMIVLASIDPTMEDILTEETQFWVVKPSVNLLDLTGLDALISGNYIQVRPVLKGKPKFDFKVMGDEPIQSNEVPGVHFYIESKVLGSMTKGSPIYYKNIAVGHIEGFELTQDTLNVHLKAFIKPEYSHLLKENSRFYNVSGLNVKGGLSGVKVEVESLVTLLKGGLSFYNPDDTSDNQASKKWQGNGKTFTLYDDFDDAKVGIEVTLKFKTAVGLSEGSTKIIYKGIVLGIVKKVMPNKGDKSVTATVILDPIAEDSLVEDTQFWQVKSKISISELQNVDTLISGEYITLRPGLSKKKQRTFFVMQNKPALSHHHPGLHLTIKSAQLGSITIASPIMYNRIKIGEVQDYELSKNRESINLAIHIWPQYVDLINHQSRFYNASGIHVNADLSGIEIQTGSMESILKGGIALFNEKSNKHKTLKKVSNGDSFTLFSDYNAAKINAFYIQVQFSDLKGLSVGGKIHYRGIEVGKVHAIDLNKMDLDTIWVTLELDSSLKKILGKHSQFWIVTAQVSLVKTANIETLITGSYINIKPIKGKQTDFFMGLDKAPLLEQANNAFTVNLTAKRLSSITIGDPVYYKQVKVGSVIGYALADTADQILIHLSIRHRFKALIRENSQFWHSSGINMNINLFGASKIRTESLESVLSGGIAFATPNNEQMGEPLASGSFFVLHDEPNDQWLQWNPIIPLAKELQQD